MLVLLLELLLVLGRELELLLVLKGPLHLMLPRMLELLLLLLEKIVALEELMTTLLTGLFPEALGTGQSFREETGDGRVWWKSASRKEGGGARGQLSHGRPEGQGGNQSHGA